MADKENKTTAGNPRLGSKGKVEENDYQSVRTQSLWTLARGTARDANYDLETSE